MTSLTRQVLVATLFGIVGIAVGTGFGVLDERIKRGSFEKEPIEVIDGANLLSPVTRIQTALEKTRTLGTVDTQFSLQGTAHGTVEERAMTQVLNLRIAATIENNQGGAQNADGELSVSYLQQEEGITVLEPSVRISFRHVNKEAFLALRELKAESLFPTAPAFLEPITGVWINLSLDDITESFGLETPTEAEYEALEDDLIQEFRNTPDLFIVTEERSDASTHYLTLKVNKGVLIPATERLMRRISQESSLTSVNDTSETDIEVTLQTLEAVPADEYPTINLAIDRTDGYLKTYTVTLELSQATLDALFMEVDAGAIPDATLEKASLTINGSITPIQTFAPIMAPQESITIEEATERLLQ